MEICAYEKSLAAIRPLKNNDCLHSITLLEQSTTSESEKMEAQPLEMRKSPSSQPSLIESDQIMDGLPSPEVDLPSNNLISSRPKFALRNDVVHKAIIRKFKSFYLGILKTHYPFLKDKRKKLLPRYTNELEEYYTNYF